ncbi:MAG: ribosome-binding factor A [Puniceicoccales bacterium]|jgi:ribosome-binding factor A|nr:ribosome-binding factor A [Puniceicoccales bacterium]
MSLHLNRVNKAIEHAIGHLLRTRFREESVPITIIDAMMTPDLKCAHIKFSVIGDEKVRRDALRFFSKHGHMIKRELGEQIPLRRIPELKFEISDAIAQGNHLVDLLNEIEVKEGG